MSTKTKTVMLATLNLTIYDTIMEEDAFKGVIRANPAPSTTGAVDYPSQLVHHE
jgi:hypothetical protein